MSLFQRVRRNNLAVLFFRGRFQALEHDVEDDIVSFLKAAFQVRECVVYWTAVRGFDSVHLGCAE